jgi:hypothetical protein
MSRKYAIALAACFALASVASADQIGAGGSMSRADFAALRTRMIGQLNSDRYAEIKPADKAAVFGALDRIGQRLAKPSLGNQDRVDIFNDQELINQITTHARAESRIYCERDEPTGTHVIRVICMSMGKWMQKQKDEQNAVHVLMDNHQAAVCPDCQFGPGG